MISGRGGRTQTAHPGPSSRSSIRPGTPELLLARDVHAGYGGAPVLRGVDLAVAAGESVALVGPSGSGKSTLLYCLAGVHKAASGAIVFAGRDVAGMDESALTDLRRRSFGFVLQFGRLVGDLTAVENVSLPLRLNGIGRRAAEQRAAGLLAEVGLAQSAHRSASTLSGGEQQRAAVARALIHDPAVVFADEPTGALDSTNGAVVLEMLTAAARDRNAALVLVTHDERIADRADRVVSMADGRLSAGARGRDA